MNIDCFAGISSKLRHAGIRLCQAAVLTLVAILAFPAGAADSRAVKSRVPPVYPELAKRMKIAGLVEIEVKVDPDGKVSEVKTITGNSALAPAAEDAVRKWKFASGSGEATVQVDVNFTLAQ